MKRSFRDVLAASHVAAVAIVLLLIWSLAATFQLLIGLVSELLVKFVFTFVAILGGPRHSYSASSPSDWFVATALLQGAVCLLAAFLLSRFVFGKNPLRVLRDYWRKRTGPSRAPSDPSR